MTRNNPDPKWTIAQRAEQAGGIAGHAHSNQQNTSSVTITELLGVESADQANNISRVSQKLAKPTDKAFAAAFDIRQASRSERSTSDGRPLVPGVYYSTHPRFQRYAVPLPCGFESKSKRVSTF